MATTTNADATLEPGMTAPRSALDIIRAIVLVATLATFAFWGVNAWPFWINIVVAVATPAITLLVWALFVGQKAVFRVHPYVRVLIELLIFVAATLAWWSAGLAWVGLGYALVAVVTGLFTGLRSIK